MTASDRPVRPRRGEVLERIAAVEEASDRADRVDFDRAVDEFSACFAIEAPPPVPVDALHAATPSEAAVLARAWCEDGEAAVVFGTAVRRLQAASRLLASTADRARVDGQQMVADAVSTLVEISARLDP